MTADLRRRRAMMQLWQVAVLTGAGGLAACGGGSGDATPSAPLPPPAPQNPSLLRLQAALARPPLGDGDLPVEVSQGQGNDLASRFGETARITPALDGPMAVSLATSPDVWGHRRELWQLYPDSVIQGHVVYPVMRPHQAATLQSSSVCGLHFKLEGRAFELLMAGTDVQVTLIANRRYMSPALIETTLVAGVPGVPLASPNTFVHFDFGSAAPREISLYATSSQGPCAIALPAGDAATPWDRSSAATMAVMADSYGSGNSPRWRGGPFLEAAALLGIEHVYIDSIGGTGYARNGGSLHTRNWGNAFVARLPGLVDAEPDIVLTAGGINDNNSVAVPGLFATGEAARESFESAVSLYFSQLREALPAAVIVALGPWAPQATLPLDPVAQSKAVTVRAALQAAGGPWVFIDNLHGAWHNSAGHSGAPAGPWQTAANAGVYLSADGVHPNPAGHAYLGSRIAADLRAALRAM